MRAWRINRSLLLAWALTLPLAGCIPFRTHPIAVPTSSAQLQTATQEELIERVNAIARSIKTLNAAVDIDPTIIHAKAGMATDIQEIGGYILMRQPAMLRMIGLMPIIRTHAFDMVSNGTEFKLWIPPRNKFYIGRNNTVVPGATGLMALRPQVIWESLLLDPIDSQDVAWEHGSERVIDPKTHKEVRQEDYRLDVIRREPQGLALVRRIYFSRVDLQPRRQTVYENGVIKTENVYDDWKQYGDAWFPSVIQISRPVEGYEITLGILKPTINEPLSDQQFSLAQPEGAEVIRLTEPAKGARVTAQEERK
jgi:hypothetical protein